MAQPPYGGTIASLHALCLTTFCSLNTNTNIVGCACMYQAGVDPDGGHLYTIKYVDCNKRLELCLRVVGPHVYFGECDGSMETKIAVFKNDFEDGYVKYLQIDMSLIILYVGSKQQAKHVDKFAGHCSCRVKATLSYKYCNTRYFYYE